jgi:hypothetical protein
MPLKTGEIIGVFSAGNKGRSDCPRAGYREGHRGVFWNMWIEYTIYSVNFLTIIYGFDKSTPGRGSRTPFREGALSGSVGCGSGIFPVDKREKRDMIER